MSRDFDPVHETESDLEVDIFVRILLLLVGYFELCTGHGDVKLNTLRSLSGITLDSSFLLVIFLLRPNLVGAAPNVIVACSFNPPIGV